MEEDKRAPDKIVPMSDRRGPSRYTQLTSTYKGMIGVWNIVDADSAFLVILDDRASRFSFFQCLATMLEIYTSQKRKL